MKSRVLIFSIIATALFTISCSRKPTGVTKADIKTFDIREQLKTASYSYKLVDTVLNHTAYATLSATVQWPEKMGDNNIKPLQDTLLKAVSKRNFNNIDEAMVHFVTSYRDMYSDDEQKTLSVKATPVDSVPLSSESNSSYDYNVTARISVLNQEYVTYQVVYYWFMGGAHGSTMVNPFTYDFKRASVITYEDLFKPDSEKALVELISQSLQNQYSAKGEDELARAGFMPDDFYASHAISLDENGNVVFHYDQYAISAYFLGRIDVALSPYDLESLLTPEGKKILKL